MTFDRALGEEEHRRDLAIRLSLGGEDCHQLSGILASLPGR